MGNPLFRRKSLEGILREQSERNAGSGGLKRMLTVRDLTFLGVAAVIGAGIFSTVGAAAYEGGPGVVFLFIITAVVCGFTALCYAEFAGRVPVSGSAYTYSYVTFGELVAWLIGWSLILEYAIGNVVVAISWSSYFTNILAGLGIYLPAWLAADPIGAKQAYEHAVATGQPTADLAWTTAPMIGDWHVIMNIPALLIVVLITALVYIGIQESKRAANAMVVLKLVLLAAVALVGVWYIKGANYVPFMPNGMGGVLGGVSAVFFAYIGFDAISTTAEECKDPQRDLPKGMLYALVISTVFYCITALVLTGMVSYSEFKGVMDPLAYVFNKVGLPGFGFIISVGAVLAATSVLLVFQLGQPRIWMSMSRDGLLPKRYSRVHPRFGTPSYATVVTGVLVGVPALFAPSDLITDLTSIGTLFAFAIVCAGVLLLPRPLSLDHEGRKRFRVPYINGRYLIPLIVLVWFLIDRQRLTTAFTSLHLERASILASAFALFAIGTAIQAFRKRLSVIPCVGMLSCTYLMTEIPTASWEVFFLWMAGGLLLYMFYGRKHSLLAGPGS